MEKILIERIDYIRKRLYRIQTALTKEHMNYDNHIENCIYNPQYTITISEIKDKIELLNEQYNRYIRKYNRAQRRLGKM
jgi:hypothetical protein